MATRSTETPAVREQHAVARTPRRINRAELFALLERHSPDPTFAADIAALTSD